jgi:DNA-binding CsgD family transcriptional regulator
VRSTRDTPAATPPPHPKRQPSRHVHDDAAGSRDAEPRPLVRRLIAEVSSGGALPDEGERLLDIEVDGVRCILVVTEPAPHVPHVVLSPREQEIARMVAEGYPNKTIAAVLEISSWTVSTHLRRVFAKLGVRTRAAMVARVLGEHLISETGSSDPRPPSFP